MRNCILERDPESGRTIMRLTGFFDGERALDLRSELARTEGEVVVDFSRVGDFDDLAVATLARMMVESEGRLISLLGLRQHHLRLFRYIGMFDVDELTGRVKVAGNCALPHA